MFIKREEVEVTGKDLTVEFEQALDQYHETVVQIREEAHDRQQVVRNRLAVLEEEDTHLQDLQHKITTSAV